MLHYDLQFISEVSKSSSPKIGWPRVIGTSKYFCYLCYLFIKHHGQFFTAHTHGRLYDQWTVPESARLDTDLKFRYASVLLRMTEEIEDAIAKPSLRRPEPMTSRQNLLLDQEIAPSELPAEKTA